MSNPKILVIDDEIGICEGIQRALSPQGFSVEMALNGDAGLSKIHENGVELVLLDIMMPGISGIDLITAIHDHDSEIVCIIITGYATVELAVRSIKAGAYDFLTKPFSVDDLLIAVNQGLERRQLSLKAKRTRTAEARARRLADETACLKELDKAKRQFMQLVTHELQSPVSAIQNYIQLILNGYVPPDQQSEILQKCVVRTQEEMILIADLLELGHIQTIGPHTRMNNVSLEEVLQTVVDSFRDQADNKKQKLIINIAKNIPPVRGEADKFKSLWANLISNAVKYTPEAGTVAINLRSERGKVIGEVRDTGIGIPSNDQPHLFTEFFRAKNARELGIYGTGLGLVIVKRIVEGAKGSIKVRSEVGGGTTFTFTLPAVAATRQ
jgi:signal transduction histidine kinase